MPSPSFPLSSLSYKILIPAPPMKKLKREERKKYTLHPILPRYLNNIIKKASVCLHPKHKGKGKDISTHSIQSEMF